MRLLVVVVTFAAALAFIAASGFMNLTFMTSLGKSDFEKQLLGIVSIAVSAFIALLPTLILWACREKRFGSVILGVPFFIGLCVFSLTSAVGFSAKNRGSISENRGLFTLRLADVKKEITTEEAKKVALGSPRLPGVIQQAMHGLELDRKWQRSGECKEPATEAMRSFCKGYFDLKGEASRSTELAAVEAKIERLKGEARGYEEKGAGREADSQTAVIGRLLGLTAREVEEGLTLLLALLVEAGAAFGLYFATGHVRVNAPKASRPEVVVESITLREVPVVKIKPVPLKQIAGPGPRRVPRVKKAAAK